MKTKVTHLTPQEGIRTIDTTENPLVFGWTKKKLDWQSYSKLKSDCGMYSLTHHSTSSTIQLSISEGMSNSPISIFLDYTEWENLIKFCKSFK